MSSKPQRIQSIDVYRGLVMFLMMAEVWHLSGVAEKLPQNGFWAFLSFHQSHVPWIGCSLHDLIQPSFSFLVGVALPFSLLSRSVKGQSRKEMWYHTIRRSLVLILLGVFLRSMHREMTYWTFEDTLSQIGLGYPFLFWLGFKNRKWQWAALATILVFYWFAFVLYPLPSTHFDYTTVGVPENWSYLMEGFSAHWNKNSNAAWAFDQWFLNLFPRESVFEYNGGGYATLSFIPTLGTMILGLIAGTMLKLEETQLLKKWGIYAVALFGLAIILQLTGVNPIVKQIWTPAWTLFSGAFCFGFMLLFHWLCDLKEIQKPFYWLKIIGMNSIAAYVLAHVGNEFIDQTFKIHLGENYAHVLGPNYTSLVSGSAILLAYWLLLKWMYNKKIFIKI